MQGYTISLFRVISEFIASCCFCCSLGKRSSNSYKKLVLLPYIYNKSMAQSTPCENGLLILNSPRKSKQVDIYLFSSRHSPRIFPHDCARNLDRVDHQCNWLLHDQYWSRMGDWDHCGSFCSVRFVFFSCLLSGARVCKSSSVIISCCTCSCLFLCVMPNQAHALLSKMDAGRSAAILPIHGSAGDRRAHVFLLVGVRGGKHSHGGQGRVASRSRRVD